MLCCWAIKVNKSSFVAHSYTYKRNGWFHVIVQPSSEDSPEQVILVTSPIPTVTRMSSKCSAS